MGKDASRSIDHPVQGPFATFREDASTAGVGGAIGEFLWLCAEVVENFRDVIAALPAQIFPRLRA